MGDNFHLPEGAASCQPDEVVIFIGFLSLVQLTSPRFLIISKLLRQLRVFFFSVFFSDTITLVFWIIIASIAFLAYFHAETRFHRLAFPSIFSFRQFYPTVSLTLLNGFLRKGFTRFHPFHRVRYYPSNHSPIVACAVIVLCLAAQYVWRKVSSRAPGRAP
jgi:hypothetical protein